MHVAVGNGPLPNSSSHAPTRWKVFSATKCTRHLLARTQGALARRCCRALLSHGQCHSGFRESRALWFACVRGRTRNKSQSASYTICLPTDMHMGANCGRPDALCTPCFPLSTKLCHTRCVKNAFLQNMVQPDLHDHAEECSRNTKHRRVNILVRSICTAPKPPGQLRTKAQSFGATLSTQVLQGVLPFVFAIGDSLSKATHMSVLLQRLQAGRGTRGWELRLVVCDTRLVDPRSRGGLDRAPKGRNTPQPRRHNPAFWPATPLCPFPAARGTTPQRQPRIALYLVAPHRVKSRRFRPPTDKL